MAGKASSNRGRRAGATAPNDRSGSPKTDATKRRTTIGDRRELLLEATTYAGAAVAALVAVSWVLQLWRADLHVPLQFWGDALFTGGLVKGTVVNGWYLVNKSLGAPGILNMADYPFFDSLHFAVVRMIALFSSDWALVINVFHLATYPLAAVSALYALRRLGASRPAAFCAAVLFALIPAHFYRGEGHLFLGAYYLVPLAVMMAVTLGSSVLPFFRSEEDGSGSRRMDLRAPRSISAAIVAAAIGLSGLYYAFFACFMFVIGGTLAALRRSDWRPLAAASLLITIVGTCVVAQMIPTWSYSAANGSNPIAVQRSNTDADFYGLRLTQMVLPIPGYRIAAIDTKLQEYRAVMARRQPSTASEASFVPLGLAGTLGLLLALGWLLFARGRSRSGSDGFGSIMDTLSVLDISAFLLGATGGLGALIGIVMIWIRAYNRISIVIAFISLSVAALAVDRWVLARVPHGWRYRVALVAAGVIVVLGVLDQTSASWVPDYTGITREYASDAKLVRKLEARVPADSMVFQLPYMAFPENGPVQSMQDYEPLRGYLQSTSLRWSYGAMKGRETDAWQAAVSQLGTAQMVAELRRAGFKAIWVDRSGYSDSGAKMLSEIASETGQTPLMSDTGEFAVFIFE